METKTLRELMSDFERLAPVQRDYRPSTMRGYTGWLKAYAQWAGPDAGLDALAPDKARKFRNHILVEKTYRPRSRAAMHTALRTFGSWLVEEDILDSNPFEVLGKVKMDDPKRRVVSETENRALLAACERIYQPHKRALARAVLAVLSYAALRRSELLALHQDDFQDDLMRPGSCKLVVRDGKGGGSRDVPICDEAAQMIRQWLPFRRAGTAFPHLFVQNTRGPLSDEGLISILTQVAHAAECAYANPHAYRHGLITRLLLQKEDLKTVSEIAGHKNTSTTINTYYHTTDVRKREVADRAALAPTPPPDDHTLPPLRLVGRDEETA